MTVVMSLLPLAVMGAIAFWLYRRIKRAEAYDELERAAAPITPAPLAPLALRGGAHAHAELEPVALDAAKNLH